MTRYIEKAAVYGRITDEALESLKRRIGAEIIDPEPFLRQITKDAIRHFAYGIGDDNPLWVDEDYAKKSKHDTLLAPPCILYTCDRTVSGYVWGLPSVHAMYSGTKWEWFKPIRVGDTITAKSRLKDLVEKKGQFAGRTINQIYETVFTDAKGELLAKADSWCIRTEREKAQTLGKYATITQHAYTEEELNKIWRGYEREERRGANPRYWENVEIGEELPLVVKGPLRVTDIIAFLMGWGGLYVKAHKLAFRQFKQHPALAIPNSLNVPEPPEHVHWDSDFARKVGVPAAYDYGPQRICWISHVLTNWMGDDGFLRKLEVQVRRFNIVGDVTWCKGRVTRKFKEDNDHLVECEVWAENQRNEVTARGTASVLLPTKK